MHMPKSTTSAASTSQAMKREWTDSKSDANPRHSRDLDKLVEKLQMRHLHDLSSTTDSSTTLSQNWTTTCRAHNGHVNQTQELHL